MTAALKSIEICMGSSCFSRGNNRNIEVIQDFLTSKPLPSGVELTGHLCHGHCKSGPNVNINGKMYHEVDPIVIIGLLTHYLVSANGGGQALPGKAWVRS
jgi:NADH:ubiquinone oxidoreductase subunit E